MSLSSRDDDREKWGSNTRVFVGATEQIDKEDPELR